MFHTAPRINFSLTSANRVSKPRGTRRTLVLISWLDSIKFILFHFYRITVGVTRLTQFVVVENPHRTRRAVVLMALIPFIPLLPRIHTLLRSQIDNPIVIILRHYLDQVTFDATRNLKLSTMFSCECFNLMAGE